MNTKKTNRVSFTLLLLACVSSALAQMDLP